MGKTTIQLLKSAASKLKDKKLQRLGGKEITEVLNALVLSLGLESKGEAILFTALFEKSCAGRSCDLDDLARYFSCTYLDIMEYVPALKSLISKGLVVQTDMSECQLVCQDFIVTNHVIDCVLENRKIEAWKKHSEESGFNRYDFCKLVDAHVQDDKVKAEELFQFLETAEKENAGMPLVKEAKAAIASLPARALFYEICYDFMDDDGEGHSDIMRILKDMYESCGARFRERGALLDGSHSLVKAGLVEISGNKEDMFLSLKGQKLFLGEDFGSFGKQYAGLDCYDFVREVAALVHSRERKRNRLGSRQQLFEKIILMEDSNPQVTSLPLIKGMIPEADCRALFYSVCDACIRGSGVALLEELDALYARKECLVHLQEFKEEKHKLQVLDLVEVRTENDAGAYRQGQGVLFRGGCPVLHGKKQGKKLHTGFGYQGETPFLFGTGGTPAPAGGKFAQGGELPVLGFPARCQRAFQRDCGLALRGSRPRHGEDRVGDAVGAEDGAGCVPCGYQPVQEHVVWREREDCKRNIHELQAAVQACVRQADFAVQRGGCHFFETSRHRFGKRGPDRERHTKHHPGRNGKAGGDPDCHHQSGRQP